MGTWQYIKLNIENYNNWENNIEIVVVAKHCILKTEEVRCVAHPMKHLKQLIPDRNMLICKYLIVKKIGTQCT